MKTIVQKIREGEDLSIALAAAASVIKRGGLVAFPTETVYGLGADALQEEAARRIYAAKGRPSDNPLIVHISSFSDLFVLAEKIPPMARTLAQAFWPGPLTMIFEKKPIVPDSTTGGLPTVAVRMPSHAVARELIQLSGCYIAAPSANTSGRPSPTTAQHVIEDLDGKIDMILDAGPVDIGLESTVVDVTGQIPVILRPGFVTAEMIQEAAGEVQLDPALLQETPAQVLRPKAPGMKYRHYAPRGSLFVVKGEKDAVCDLIRRRTARACAEGKRVGILASLETADRYPEGMVRTIGSREDEASIARGLFAALREFDHLQADLIFAEDVPEGGLGMAIRNRLLKAAGYQILKAGEDTEGKNVDETL